MFYDVSLEKGWVPILFFSLSVVFFAITIPFLPKISKFFPFLKKDRTKSDSQPQEVLNSGQRSTGHRLAKKRSSKKPVMRFSPKKTLIIQLSVSVPLCLVWLFLLYMASDVWIVFGVSLGCKVIRTAAIGGFFVFWMIASVFLFRSARRIAIIFGVAVLTLNTALAVSNVYGQYPTIGALLGKSTLAQLSDDELENIKNAAKRNREKPENERMTIARWKGSQEQKQTDSSSGFSSTIHIEGTVSGFKAEDAQIYIPAAALSSAPPDLPVVVMLTGQPGNPVQAFQGGKIDQIAAKYAEEHDGLSPIVVVPDQLNEKRDNTLCLNTVNGNVETYLTVDVINWLKDNLPVSSDSHDWTLGGFSMGATCTVTLGPLYPQIWGNLMAFSSEGRPAENITEKEAEDYYFGGDVEKYKSYYPTELMKKAAPSEQNLFLAAGTLDIISEKNEATIGQAAVQSGMTVSSALASDAGHDWRMTSRCFEYFFALLGKQSGISSENVDRSRFDKLCSSKVIPFSEGTRKKNVTAER